MPRIIYFSDTHAERDHADRDGTNDWTGKGTRNMQNAIIDLQPTHIHHLGDLIDFLPAEWDDVKTQIDWIKVNYPNVKLHAIMGNHDYERYDYPQIRMNFPEYVPEYNAILMSQANVGTNVIEVDTVTDVIVGQKILLIQTPEYDTTTPWFLSTVQSVDTVNKRITLTDNLDKTFYVNQTAVRQGYEQQRGIDKFLEVFRGTATQATKHYYTIGNNVFIFLSMDTYHKTSGQWLDAIPPADLDWLEDIVSKYHLTHNVFINTHIPPDTGAVLGYYEWMSPSLSYFTPEIKARFKAICANYKVVMWTFGHNHTPQYDLPGRPNLTQASGWGNTWFFGLPSTTFGGNSTNGAHNFDGQIPYYDLTEGITELTINNYSTTNKTVFRTQTVPLNYPVQLENVPNIIVDQSMPFALNSVKTVYPWIVLPIYSDATLTTADNSAGTLILGQINNRTKYILNNTTKVVKTFLRATVDGVNYDSAPQILQPDEAQPFTVNIDLTGVTSVTSVFLYAVTKAVN